MFRSLRFGALALCLIGVLVGAVDPSTTVLPRNSRRFTRAAANRAFDINWGACTLNNIRGSDLSKRSIEYKMSEARGVAMT